MSLWTLDSGTVTLDSGVFTWDGFAADQVVTGQTGGGIRVHFRKSQWVVPGLRRPEVPALVQAPVSVQEADDVLRCSASVIWPPVSAAENQSEWLQLMAA